MCVWGGGGTGGGVEREYLQVFPFKAGPRETDLLSRVGFRR